MSSYMKEQMWNMHGRNTELDTLTEVRMMM